MATILSNNYNGSVEVSANAGFSVKKAVARIEKEIVKIGFSTSKEIAKTGTTYIEVWDENDNMVTTIRVSNHTKRGYSAKEMETFVFVSDRFGSIVIEKCNVIDTKSLGELISNIDNFKKFNN